MVHIVADITGHGFGHISQTGPILMTLKDRFPQVRYTLRTQAQTDKVREMIPLPFHVAAPPPDFGMYMTSPYHIDTKTSEQTYQQLIANWQTILDDETHKLAALKPDLLISNVGFVGLAAAQKLSIPNTALSSLNWADILAAYSTDHTLINHIQDIYNQADQFIRLTPALEMPWACNTKTAGPVGRKVEHAVPNLRQYLNLPENTKVILYSLGGIKTPDHQQQIPYHHNLHWIIGSETPIANKRDDITSLDNIGHSFIDCLTSCDAVIAKIGYGIFVEAALNGSRLLFGERDDWPESRFLENWVSTYVATRKVSQKAFIKGDYLSELLSLLEKGCPEQTCEATGIEDCVAYLTPFIQRDTL